MSQLRLTDLRRLRRTGQTPGRRLIDAQPSTRPAPLTADDRRPTIRTVRGQSPTCHPCRGTSADRSLRSTSPNPARRGLRETSSRRLPKRARDPISIGVAQPPAPAAPHQSPTGVRENYSATTARNTAWTMPASKHCSTSLHDDRHSPSDAALEPDGSCMRPVHSTWGSPRSGQPSSTFTDTTTFVLVGADRRRQVDVIDAMHLCPLRHVPMERPADWITPRSRRPRPACGRPARLRRADGQRYAVAPRSAPQRGGRPNECPCTPQLESLHHTDDLDG